MIIYHYCSGDSFLGIIGSKKLWLSGIMNMSDYSEILWAKKMVIEELEGLAHNFEHSIIDEFWAEYTANTFQPFICCFSSAQDRLSQWRGYADDGRGFSIGFDSEVLCESKGLPSLAHGAESKLTLNRVEYDTNEARRTIHSYVEGALSAILTDKKYQSKNLAELSDKEKYELLNAACHRYGSHLLRGYQVTVKNPAFIEESEYRLVHMPPWFANVTTKLTTNIQFSLSSPKYRISRDRLCTYFELNFGHLIDAGVIKEIWLGPKNQTTDMDINALLGDSGLNLERAQVQRSRVTYR